jgi:hypothetical protein
VRAYANKRWGCGWRNKISLQRAERELTEWIRIKERRLDKRNTKGNTTDSASVQGD